jgi:hypothetical protein
MHGSLLYDQNETVAGVSHNELTSLYKTASLVTETGGVLQWHKIYKLNNAVIFSSPKLTLPLTKRIS